EIALAHAAGLVDGVLAGELAPLRGLAVLLDLFQDLARRLLIGREDAPNADAQWLLVLAPILFVVGADLLARHRILFERLLLDGALEGLPQDLARAIGHARRLVDAAPLRLERGLELGDERL